MAKPLFYNQSIKAIVTIMSRAMEHKRGETMDNYFSIGELSKYQNISNQTLIYYDKIGLFRPAYVDPDNGYRYYSTSQIDKLDTILIMKKIGFSLKEIREYMKDYTIDSSLVVLRRQLTVIRQQIRELRLIENRLSHRCSQMEQAKGYIKKEVSVIVENVPSQYILLEKVDAPYSMREISIATKQCFAGAFKDSLPVFFECGVIVPMERIISGRCTQASHAFLPIEKTDKSSSIRRLPEGLCASIFHVGDYMSIGNSYKKILDYCSEHHLEILSDSYEFCVNDYITTDDENEYITKIMFYVRENVTVHPAHP